MKHSIEQIQFNAAVRYYEALGCWEVVRVLTNMLNPALISSDIFQYNCNPYQSLELSEGLDAQSGGLRLSEFHRG